MCVCKSVKYKEVYTLYNQSISRSKTFGLEDSRLVGTPMDIGHKISKNDDSTQVNQTLYRSMIVKLQYVVHRRPDIALTIEILARFFTNPKENHMMVVKRILRCLRGI